MNNPQQNCQKNLERVKDTNKLSISFRTAYVKTCQEYSRTFPDWNEAFQLTWELEDSTEDLAKRRFMDLRRIETEFKKEIAQAVKSIVDRNFRLPVSNYSFVSKDKHGLQYQERNVFYQVLNDVKTGKRYLESLRGILLSGSPDLSVPLSEIVVYRGLPFLAQALAPLQSLLHNGQDVVNEEISEIIRITSAASNLPLPEYIQCSVYQARDGRRYVTSTNTATIPLVVTELEAPLQRSEMLLSPLAPLIHPVTTTMNNVFNSLKSPELIYSIRTLGRIPTLTDNEHSTKVFHQEQQNRLCAIMHYFGINLMLLPLLLGTCLPTLHCRDSVAQIWDDVKRVIGVELLARTIKNKFYILSSANRLVGDEKAQENLSRSILWGLQGSTSDSCKCNFNSSSTDQVFRKFCTDPNLLKETAEILENCRTHSVETIVSRVCILVGVKKGNAVDSKLSWEPVQKGQLFPRLLSPEVQRYWAAVTRKKEQESKAISSEKGANAVLELRMKLHKLVFWNPLLARVHLWKNNHTQCVQIQKTSLLAIKQLQKEGHEFLSKTPNHELESFPSTSFLHLRFLYTHIHSLFQSRKPQNAIQGCALIPVFLDESKKLKVSALALSQYHIRFGCLLLGLKSWTQDANIEAARHFVTAESLIADSFRDYLAVRLYIQACFGILHCDLDFSSKCPLVSGVYASKSLLEKLMHHSIILANRVDPTEQFVEYLWTLGLEVGSAKIQMFHEGVKLLTKAHEMAKQVPNCRVSQDIIMNDLLQMYCTWNEGKYKQYCSQVTSSSALPSLEH